MHLSTRLGLAIAAAVTVLLSSLPGPASAQCLQCSHNNEPGRWLDKLAPTDRIAELCRLGRGCYQGTMGKMCVSGDMSECSCAVEAAAMWQSYSWGFWYLWNVVDCGGLIVSLE